VESRRPNVVSALKYIAQAERVVTFLAFLVLTLVLFADVVSRQLTGAGLIWARDVGVLANFVLTLVGIGIASAEGAHLRPRFADHWVPAAWNAAIEILREALMAAFCLAFALVAIVAVAETYRLEERMTILHGPVWVAQLVIPGVFLIASLRHAVLAAFPGLRASADTLANRDRAINGDESGADR
jgi:TRAP-type C4-dicarboxylate transport system permease small subunit